MAEEGAEAEEPDVEVTMVSAEMRPTRFRVDVDRAEFRADMHEGSDSEAAGAVSDEYGEEGWY